VETGKHTAEIGLIFRVLHALDLVLEATPNVIDPDVDLDNILRAHG
jgi:hypothetical protein